MLSQLTLKRLCTASLNLEQVSWLTGPRQRTLSCCVSARPNDVVSFCEKTAGLTSHGPSRYVLSNTRMLSTPSFTKKPKRRRKFIPRKAAVQLTDKARNFFKALLENSPAKDGIILNYKQASSGQPRMVFAFDFVTKDQISEEDEGVSLELLEDGTPKSPKDSMDDGLPKLYVHHNAFLKVLGGTLDVDTEKISPILYDREGNRMDPNA